VTAFESGDPMEYQSHAVIQEKSFVRPDAVAKADPLRTDGTRSSSESLESLTELESLVVDPIVWTRSTRLAIESPLDGGNQQPEITTFLR
jgi:hypothetical protein